MSSELFGAVVVAGGSFRWPGGIIPFEVAAALPAAQQTAVTNAIQHWHDQTRLLLRPNAPTDRQWVRFETGTGCSSPAGRKNPTLFDPAPQRIELA